jgi:hypothetical protein
MSVSERERILETIDRLKPFVEEDDYVISLYAKLSLEKTAPPTKIWRGSARSSAAGHSIAKLNFSGSLRYPLICLSSKEINGLAKTLSHCFYWVFSKWGDAWADRPLPNWVLDVEAGDPDAMAAANEWLVSDLAQPWLRDTGSPPRWLRLALTPQVIEPVPYLASLSRVIISRHYVSRIQSLC